METWTKTCGPIPGGLMLIHPHVATCLSRQPKRMDRWVIRLNSVALPSANLYWVAELSMKREQQMFTQD